MASSSSNKLELMYDSLKLMDEEDSCLIIGDEDFSEVVEDNILVLVGKLITEKPFKFHIMKETMASVWRPGRGMRVTEIASNLFWFELFHELDVSRILEDGPWALEQSLLVLHCLQPNESPLEVEFTQSEFWVHAHNIPPGFLIENVAKAIGSHIGELVKVDKNNFDESGKHS